MIPAALKDARNVSRIAAAAIFLAWGVYVFLQRHSLDDPLVKLPSDATLAPLFASSGVRVALHLLFYVFVAMLMSIFVAIVIERKWPKKVKVTTPGGGGFEAEALDEVSKASEGLEYQVGMMQGSVANLANSVQNIEEDIRYLHERVGEGSGYGKTRGNERRDASGD